MKFPKNLGVPTSSPMHVASIVQKPVPKSFLFVLDVLVNLVDVIDKAVYLAEAPFDEIEFVIKLPNFIAQ